MFSNKPKYKKQRIFRVIVNFVNGNIGTGSGFFINNKGRLLTCFHVVFGGELKNIRTSHDFISISGHDERNKLQTWFSKKISSVHVELIDGSKEKLILKNFDEKYDIAFLDLQNMNSFNKTKYCKLSFRTKLKQGRQVFFAGFPVCYPYKAEECPFAINTGMISSFPETIIGGDEYQHVQINAINLGGNSGAPLFLKNRDRVIGIINGNMNWGADNVAFINPDGQTTKAPLRVPLSIAFATSLKTLMDNSEIFRTMIKKNRFDLLEFIRNFFIKKK